MHSWTYSTSSGIVFEELKVYTVHQPWRWSVNSVYVSLLLGPRANLDNVQESCDRNTTTLNSLRVYVSNQIADRLALRKLTLGNRKTFTEFISNPSLIKHKDRTSLYNLPWHFFWRHAVAQLIEALCYKRENRRFDSLWCHWNFLLI